MTLDGLLPADFVKRHKQLPLFSEHLATALQTHVGGLTPLTRVEVERIKSPKQSPRIDTQEFEVYRLKIYGNSISPIMDIEVALTYPFEDVHPDTDKFVQNQTSYFYQNLNEPKSKNLSRSWPLGLNLGNIAVLVDPELDPKSIAIAKDLVTSLNKSTDIHAVEYNRNRIREAIQRAFLTHRVTKLDRFGEVYSRILQYEHCPPPLIARRGYIAQFSQGTNLYWIVEFDKEGRITNVVVLDKIGLEGKKFRQQEWQSFWKPLDFGEVREYKQLAQQLRNVILEYGKIMGHTYTDEEVAGITTAGNVGIPRKFLWQIGPKELGALIGRDVPRETKELDPILAAFRRINPYKVYWV